MEKRQEKSGHKKIRGAVGAVSAFEGVVSTCPIVCTRTRDGVKRGGSYGIVVVSEEIPHGGKDLGR
ncbi:MAG: hypothetical protein M0041_00015 [Nitrospiraceae bacterium]|nr:hypothetical protein [Nitrospiraceae bacterium]